jgi:hypothetical protein
MMLSETNGINTSETEISHISKHGIWLISKNTEYSLAYELFPWFKDASIAKVLNVEEVTPSHFFWPDLDVDLGIDSIENPDRFPLIAQLKK